jgi:hypothetical protein
LQTQNDEGEENENEEKEPAKVEKKTNLKSLSHSQQSYIQSPMPYAYPTDVPAKSYQEIAKLNEKEKDRMIYYLLDKVDYLIKTSCKEIPINQYQPSFNLPMRPSVPPSYPVPTTYLRPPAIYPLPKRPEYDPAGWNRYPIGTSTPSYYNPLDTTSRPTSDSKKQPVYPADESYGRYLYISEEKFWNLYDKLIKSTHDREFLANMRELEQYVMHAQTICEKSKAFSSVLSKIKRPAMIPNGFDNSYDYRTNIYQPYKDNLYRDNNNVYPLYNYPEQDQNGYAAYNYDNGYPAPSKLRYPSSFDQYQSTGYDKDVYEYDEPVRYRYK